MVFVMSMLLYAVVEIYLIKLPYLYALTMNIFTITLILMMILGLSVTKFFLDKFAVPKALKGILMIFLLVAFSNITMIIGVFDMVFDFRKLLNKSTGDV